MRCVRRHPCPEVADANWLPLQCVVGIERPNAVFEAADGWHIDLARTAAIQPPYRPLFLFWIIGAQRHSAISSPRQIEHTVPNVAQTAEDLLPGAGPLELDPFMIISEPLLQPAVMHPPVAHEEIEIVATISCADRPTSAIMHLADLAFLLRRSLAGRWRVPRNPRILVCPVGFPRLSFVICKCLLGL